VLALTHEELPVATGVVSDRWEEVNEERSAGLLVLSASIWSSAGPEEILVAVQGHDDQGNRHRRPPGPGGVPGPPPLISICRSRGRRLARGSRVLARLDREYTDVDLDP